MGREGPTTSSILSASEQEVKRKQERSKKDKKSKKRKLEGDKESSILSAGEQEKQERSKKDKKSKKRKLEGDKESSILSAGEQEMKRKQERSKKDKKSKKRKLEGDKESEKRKLEVRHASVGHSSNVNNRHVMQLEGVAALMSIKEHSLEITDDMIQVLKKPGCSNGLYLQWDKKEDRYFLWGSSTQEKLLIKFEFHGGIEIITNQLDTKNPLLAFSEEFDHGSEWKEVKQLLKELFGPADEPVTCDNHDYLFAFTRSGELFHFRIFKILTHPSLEMENLKLEEMSLSFVLHLLEIHRPSDVTIEDEMIQMLIDEDKFLFEKKRTLKLSSNMVFYDTSCQTLVPHMMTSTFSNIKIMLPLPAKNLQWLGFNTNGKEFFERYHPYKTTHVPGTGPCPHLSTSHPTVASITSVDYDQITLPMKIFSRELIISVKEIHKYGCLSKFDKNNVFFRRGKIVILGVKLLRYTTVLAKENFISAHSIIMQSFNGMKVPLDVQYALKLLYEDPLESYEIISNNFAWMEAKSRNRMIVDLHEDFSELTPTEQLHLTTKLPDMSIWIDKFAKNRLLYDIQTDKVSSAAAKNMVDLNNYFAKKAAETQWNAAKNKNPMDLLASSDRKDDLLLYSVRRYVKGIRNAYVHLKETSIKLGLGALSPVMVDLVVSSEFATTCSALQVDVPDAFKKSNTPERAASSRFKEYFRPVEDIEFQPDDEKL